MAGPLYQDHLWRNALSLAYDLTQIVDKPTHVPDQAGHFSNLLDLFLTSSPDACSLSVHSPLGSSDHCLIQVKVEAKCSVTPDAPFHRKVFRYSKADWDGFRSYISEIPVSDIFKNMVLLKLPLTSLIGLLMEWNATSLLRLSSWSQTANRGLHPNVQLL